MCGGHSKGLVAWWAFARFGCLVGIRNGVLLFPGAEFADISADDVKACQDFFNIGERARK